MNNSGWQTARKKVGLRDVRVQDLRHTAATRLREAGIEKATISSVMWHGEKTITDHYTMAQVIELYEALEKVASPVHRFNPTVASLVREAKERRLTQKSPMAGLQKENGLAVEELTR